MELHGAIVIHSSNHEWTFGDIITVFAMWVVCDSYTVAHLISMSDVFSIFAFIAGLGAASY